jgi:hypothetical protein
VSAAMSVGADPALRKLVNVMGEAKAEELAGEILRSIGRTELATPDDRYLFAVELMKRGGMLEAIGRAIKIQAILMGAKAT